MSAAERVRASYAAIEAADRPEVWITLRPLDEALAEAEGVDARTVAGERLPLAGLVVAVKDNIDVAGLPTTAGAPSYSYVPDADATCVARLRAAGAVMIGKTNMDQFATGLVGTRSPYGAVRNACDPDRISGGSSSGSAVAVALGLADLALGTDTAGSGRVPAALNGIVGVKPTRGLIPATGVVPACRSLDCVTVFARSLDLAGKAIAVMAGPDGKDPLARALPPLPPAPPASGWPERAPGLTHAGPNAHSVPLRAASASAAPSTSTSTSTSSSSSSSSRPKRAFGLTHAGPNAHLGGEWEDGVGGEWEDGAGGARVAIPLPEQLGGLAEGWGEAFGAAVGQFRAAGAEVVSVDIAPLLEAATLLYSGAFVAERYAAVGAHIEAHNHLIGTDLDATVARIILDGAKPTAAEYFADRERLDLLAARATQALAGFDALLTPTTTAHPTLDEVAADPIGVNARLGRFTNFANLLDMAAIAVPAGRAGTLPFGIMLTSAAGSDAHLARLAAPFA